MQKVLVYSKEGHHREQIRKAVSQLGFKASFTADTSIVTSLMLEIKPYLYIQDWHSLDPNRNAELLQRVHRTEINFDLIKLVCVEKVTAGILAVSGECGIRKVVSYATLGLTLDSIISMLQMSNKQEGQFTRTLTKLREGTSNEEVEAHIDQAFKEYGHIPEIRLEYGGLCVNRDELAKAEMFATDLLDKDKSNVRAMNLLSRVYMKKGNFDMAAKVLEGANILSPNQPGRLVMLGDAFYGKGDKKKAAAFYDKAVEQDPSNSEALNKSGNLKLEEGDVNALLELFSNHGSEAEKAGFFNNAAVANVKQEKYKEALELYDLALKTMKSDSYKSKIYINISLAYRKWGRFEDALKAAKRSLKYDKGFDKAKRQIDDLEELLHKQAG